MKGEGRGLSSERGLLGMEGLLQLHVWGLRICKNIKDVLRGLAKNDVAF